MVGRGEPLTCTTDALMNPEPLTVRVKLGPSTSAVAGEMFEMEGTGLLTVNVTAAEVPPPGAGVKTVMDNKAPTARSDAGIAAVNCVAFTKLVDRFDPLTRTTDPATKLPPLTVSVNPELPAIALAGEMLPRDGTGLATVSVSADEVPPPGAGFTAVTDKLPALATSDAAIAAVSCVPLTKVVVRLAPFTFTTVPEIKLLPVKVRVNPALPGETVDGEMLANEGTGLLTANGRVPDVKSPGLMTRMLRVPAEAMSPEGMDAVS